MDSMTAKSTEKQWFHQLLHMTPGFSKNHTNANKKRFSQNISDQIVH